MADSRIQDLPAIDALGDGDLFPVAREGDGYNARKVTAGQMTNYIAGVAQPYLTGAQEAASKAEAASKTAVEAVDQIGTAVEDTRAAQKAAEAARDEAVAAGDGLSEIRDQTVNAAEQAQAAVGQIAGAADAAEAAKQAAEIAQGAAEAASGTATSSATQASQSAQNAQQSAQSAQTAKEGAEAAQAAIENLGVDATTLESGSPATVQKTVENGVVKLTFGLPTGNKGDKGDTGESMGSIERVSGTGAPGTYDTYNVVLTDGSVVGQFQVYNGADGQGAGDMLKAVYDPQNKNTDVFAYVDQAVQDIPVPDVSAQIAQHNADASAHPDIRAELAGKEQAGAAAGVQSNLDAHVADKKNPHATTAEQVGADPEGSAAQALTDAKSYTDQKISEIPTPDVSAQIADHNVDGSAHPDLREGLAGKETAGAAAAVQSNLDAHVKNKQNPHDVTAEQVGAIPVPPGGSEGQVLTKTSNGQAWQNAPDGLPDGGAEGQILIKTASGAAWGDVPSSGGAHYVSVFTAEDWVKAERDSTITISAATHKLTGPIVDCRAFIQISGGYRAGSWAAMETYATVEGNGDIVIHYPNSAGYDGAAVLTAYAPGS